MGEVHSRTVYLLVAMKRKTARKKIVKASERSKSLEFFIFFFLFS